VRHQLLLIISQLFHADCTGLVGYANGSVEGRIAVEYFSASQEDKKYAFKCHRQTIDDVDHVWPVNALAFHPMFVSLFFFFCSWGSYSLIPNKQINEDITRLHQVARMAPFLFGIMRSRND
jgi:hypothetical protein